MGSNGSRVGFWIAIVVLAIGLGGSFLLNVGLGAILMATPSAQVDVGPADENLSFKETWSAGHGSTKVVRIDLVGVIMRGRQDRLFGYEPDMVERILGQIKVATKDPSVKAILLEVDSPGGSVTPSDEIYNALKNFKKKDESRIILVFIRGLGASGAYYAAMAGDYVMAEPTAIVGSVGVIMQTMNMKGLAEKLGVQSVTIASGKNKDMLNPFTDVNPQHLSMLQELVDRMQDRFASIVVESRGFKNRDLLDGRVFDATQALEHNFIDGIGYWSDAVVKLEVLLGEDEIRLIRYEKKQTFFETLMASKGPEIPTLKTMSSPQFLYQWTP